MQGSQLSSAADVETEVLPPLTAAVSVRQHTRQRHNLLLSLPPDVWARFAWVLGPDYSSSIIALEQVCKGMMMLLLQAQPESLHCRLYLARKLHVDAVEEKMDSFALLSEPLLVKLAQGRFNRADYLAVRRGVGSCQVLNQQHVRTCRKLLKRYIPNLLPDLRQAFVEKEHWEEKLLVDEMGIIQAQLQVFGTEMSSS